MNELKNNNKNKKKSSKIPQILVCFVFLTGSLTLTLWNEFRYDISKLINASTDAMLISSPRLEGTKGIESTNTTVINNFLNNNIFLNFLTGNISINNRVLGIDILKDGKYVAVRRYSEMYSWVKQPSKEDPEKYTYQAKWVEKPEVIVKSSTKENPNKEIPSTTVTSNYMVINDIEIKKRGLYLNHKDIWTDIPTNSDKLMIDAAANYEKDKLFFYQGSKDKPKIGDIRIKYQIIPADTKVTVFGIMDEDTLIANQEKDKNKLFSFFPGTKEDAAKFLSPNYLTTLWGLRGISAILIWIGLIKLAHIINGQIKLGSILIAAPISVATALSYTVLHGKMSLISTYVLAIASVFLFKKAKEIKEEIDRKREKEAPLALNIPPKHKGENDEDNENAKKKKEQKNLHLPPKPIDMREEDISDIDDMSITLSSGEKVDLDIHHHGILPSDMPPAKVPGINSTPPPLPAIKG
ncbi:MAG: hypothetical protein GY804_14595 [Alphaproteobacteria bacterium]|nr:hypothetical protein [Alphaproteobacteria bacterium]